MDTISFWWEDKVTKSLYLEALRRGVYDAEIFPAMGYHEQPSEVDSFILYDWIKWVPVQ